MEFITKIFMTHTFSWPNIRVIHKMRLHRCDLLIMSYVVYQTSKSSLTPPKKKTKRMTQKYAVYYFIVYFSIQAVYKTYTFLCHSCSCHEYEKAVVSVSPRICEFREKKIAETEKSYARVIIKIARYRKCNKTLILLYYIFSIKH